MKRNAALLALVFAAVVLAAPAQSPQDEYERPPSRTGVQVPEEQKVDINRATLKQLLRLPGMTRSWAGRIVKYRPYRSKADLLDQGILPEDVYERFRDYVIAHRMDGGVQSK